LAQRECKSDCVGRAERYGAVAYAAGGSCNGSWNLLCIVAVDHGHLRVAGLDTVVNWWQRGILCVSRPVLVAQ